MSKSANRSDHKHEYEPCILKRVILYTWVDRCEICGKIRWRFDRASDRQLLRKESVGKPGIGLNDYLSVAEMQEAFPGGRVFEEFLGPGNEFTIKEIFK